MLMGKARSMKEEKVLQHWATNKVEKLLRPKFKNFCNKLECFSLAGLSGLFQCFGPCKMVKKLLNP
jgi:hypothetical protein